LGKIPDMLAQSLREPLIERRAVDADRAPDRLNPDQRPNQA
jgi:hypothetical protein